MVRVPLVDQVMSAFRKGGAAKRTPIQAEREERLRAAFERAPMGIAYCTPDGHWIQVNLRFRQLVGYTREQLTRISFNDLTHPDDAREEAALVRKLVAGEIEQFRLRKRVMERKGRYRPIEMMASMVRSTHGDAEMFIYIIDDPHEAAARGDATAEAERLVVAIAEELQSVAIIRSDDRGIITGWNQGAEKIFGYSREEAVGKSRRVLYRDPDVWEDKPGTQLRAVSEHGRMDLEDWRVTKGGQHYWVATSIIPYRREGIIKGYVEVITDAGGTRTPSGEAKRTIEGLRDELAKRERTEESLKIALEDVRVMGEETQKELRIMAVALRNEMDRRKAVEGELRQAHERVAALAKIPVAVIPPPVPEPEPQELEVVIPPEESAERTWRSLDGTSPAELLIKQGDGRVTGTLMMRLGDKQKEIFFEKGRIFSVSSNDPSRFLAQRLVSMGIISEEQRRRALEIQKETHLALGRVLVILSALTEEQLLDAMRKKAEEEIAEVFEWRAARYAWIEGQIPTLQLVPLRIEVAPLVVQRLNELGETTLSTHAEAAAAAAAAVAAPEPEPAPEPPPMTIDIEEELAMQGDETQSMTIMAMDEDELPQLEFDTMVWSPSRKKPSRDEGRRGGQEPLHLVAVAAEPEVAVESEPEPMPEPAREPEPEAEPAMLVIASASGKSKKYHRPTCMSVRRVSSETQIRFASEASAADAGFERCRMCFR